MRRTRAPRHRGRWTPFHPRAVRGAAPGVLGAAVVMVLGVTATAYAVGEAGRVAAAPVSAAAPATVEGAGAVELSADRSVASAARIRASAPQDPRPLQSDPAAAVTPVHLRIERIDVDVDLTRLDRREDGTLEPPTGLMEAGWYRDSAVPGAIGPSVIAGHVDDTDDAGIFARLHELSPGDDIVVTLSDGTETTFAADFTADVSKAEFPTDAVYGATRTPQLRLITCNGPYDFESMHYRNNLVLFASLRGA